MQSGSSSLVGRVTERCKPCCRCRRHNREGAIFARPNEARIKTAMFPSENYDMRTTILCDVRNNEVRLCIQRQLGSLRATTSRQWKTKAKSLQSRKRAFL